MILILMTLFLLSKTQNYMPLLAHNQQKTTTNYQSVLAKDLKHQCVGMKIKQKVRIKIQQMNIDTFLN